MDLLPTFAGFTEDNTSSVTSPASDTSEYSKGEETIRGHRVQKRKWDVESGCPTTFHLIGNFIVVRSN